MKVLGQQSDFTCNGRRNGDSAHQGWSGSPLQPITERQIQLDPSQAGESGNLPKRDVREPERIFGVRGPDYLCMFLGKTRTSPQPIEEDMSVDW